MMPVCPPTVKQTMVQHPLAGPALVSPDITVAAKDKPLKSIRLLPTHANKAKDPQSLIPSTVTARETPVSPDVKLLAPRNGKWT